MQRYLLQARCLCDIVFTCQMHVKKSTTITHYIGPKAEERASGLMYRSRGPGEMQRGAGLVGGFWATDATCGGSCLFLSIQASDQRWHHITTTGYYYLEKIVFSSKRGSTYIGLEKCGSS